MVKYLVSALLLMGAGIASETAVQAWNSYQRMSPHYDTTRRKARIGTIVKMVVVIVIMIITILYVWGR